MPKPPAAFSPLAIGEIDGVLFLQLRQAFVNDGAAGPAEDVSDEEYPQGSQSFGLR